MAYAIRWCVGLCDCEGYAPSRSAPRGRRRPTPTSWVPDLAAGALPLDPIKRVAGWRDARCYGSVVDGGWQRTLGVGVCDGRLIFRCLFTLRTDVLYSRHVEAHESLFDAVCPARAAARGGWHQGFVRGRQRNRVVASRRARLGLRSGRKPRHAPPTACRALVAMRARHALNSRLTPI